MINQINKNSFSLTEREELFDKILEIINAFKDEKLKREILKLLNKNKEVFLSIPAGKNSHHKYVGGLVKHSWECMEFAKVLFTVSDIDFNQEIILAACVMHDFGKIFEYNINLETGVIEKNKNWIQSWNSHIYWGMSWANTNEFFELAHIIASHHSVLNHSHYITSSDSKEASMFYGINYLSVNTTKYDC